MPRVPVGGRGGPRIGDLAFAREPAREPAEVDFMFAAGRSPVAAADVALTTALGLARESVPAALAGIEGRSGAGRLALDLSAVPPGACELTLALVGRDGRAGPSASVAFELPGGDGAGPSLLGVKARDPRLARPRGGDVVIGRLAVDAAPGAHEPAAAWARIRRPDGTEVAAVTAPVAGEDVVPVAAFRSTDELGPYAVALTLVDRAGNVSDTLEASLELTDGAGAAGPSIEGFSPARAAAGEEVLLSGRGLERKGLTVEVGGVAVDVLAADADGLRIRMPELDRPGFVTVTGADGWGTSAEPLTPTVSLRIVPDVIEVPPGVSVSLTAVVTGSTDGAVEWRVTAGRGEPGTISPEGLYTPPPGGATGKVTIAAVSAADPSASARAAVRVVPHPAARGPLPLGPLGGTVRSADDAAALEFTSGALGELTTIGVEVDRDLDLDGSEGTLVVGGVAITGAPRDLGAPADLTIPLKVPLDAGTKVAVQFRDDPSGPWQDLPDFGLVIPGDEALKIRLQSVHDFYRGGIHYTPPQPSFLPTISSLTPSAINEGETAAVLVNGKNFVPGVTTVTVLKAAGGVETRVDVRKVSVTADGTKLGVTLKAGIMTDLAEGSTRSLTLRVTTPAGSASRTLEIIGHDELDVPAGTRQLTATQAFSRVRVNAGATLRIAHDVPPLTVTAYETIVVGDEFTGARGTVDVVTGSGANATVGSAGGAGGAGGATGPFAGVPGRGGAGGAGGFSASGNGTPGSSGSAPPGQLANSGGGAGFAGYFIGFDGVNGAPARVPGLPSASFDPPFVAGAGGGGGGGGGGETVFGFNSTAGGGGGGGAGAGALRLEAGEEIRITGRVAANGGDGGNGAFPFPVGSPPSAPPTHAGCGGGGGSGGGGTVLLHGIRKLIGEVLAVGGANGTAARFADAVITTSGAPLTPLQRLLLNPRSGLIRIDGRAAATPTIAPGAFSLVPDLDYIPDLVVAAPQATVTGLTGGTVRVRNGSGQHFFPTAGDPFTATVTLAPGFNDVDGVVVLVNDPTDPNTFIVNSAAQAVRVRRILFLQGVVSSFGFACTVSPATPTVVTERSVTLTATVTGTTQTAVAWSVDGGAVNGAVDQQGVYIAPCAAPAAPVTVRASSQFDPSRSGTAAVTVLAGISLSGQAAVGTPADPAIPSRNVGQAVAITIPAAARALTGQGFAAGQSVVFPTIRRDPAGACATGTAAVAGTVATGMGSLTATVPPCAAPAERVRVPGHGCARLQIVPRITGLTKFGAGLLIAGTGFACGATEVRFGGVPVPAAQVLLVDCNSIQLGTQPAMAGQAVTVRTAGGTSNAAPAP